MDPRSPNGGLSLTRSNDWAQHQGRSFVSIVLVSDAVGNKRDGSLWHLADMQQARPLNPSHDATILSRKMTISNCKAHFSRSKPILRNDTDGANGHVGQDYFK